MYAKKITLLVISICLITQNIIGQKNPKDDFEAWGETSIKYKMNKGWDLGIQYRAKFTNNASYFKGSYLFGELEKKINKTFDILAIYRLALADDGTYHRYALGITGQKKWGKFTASLRPMVQYQKQNYNGDNTGTSDTDTYLRTRLNLKIQVAKKLEAYMYTEPFFKLDQTIDLDLLRNSAGIKYNYARNKKVNLFYISQPDYSKKTFRTNRIAGLSLDFTIKQK